jgi:hypothetical protein
MAAAMVHGRRMAWDGFVQVLPVQRHVELRVVEHERRDPLPGRRRAGLPVERLLELRDGADVGVHLVQLIDAARMAMRIDEAGRHRHLCRIDHLRPSRHEIPDVAGAADGDEPAVLDRERLRPWDGGVDGVHTRVHHRDVRLAARIAGGGLRRSDGRHISREPGASQRSREPKKLTARHFRHLESLSTAPRLTPNSRFPTANVLG